MNGAGDEQSFSRRHGHTSDSTPITIWEDAPEGLRVCLLSAAKDTCNLGPSTLRSIVCKVLRVRPDPSNWSEYPNIWHEVQHHVYSCDWFRVYDFIEAVGQYLLKDAQDYPAFEAEINRCMREMGIGWQLSEGRIESRSADEAQKVLNEARQALEDENLETPKRELEEAILDLSRRPTPDLSGAVQHSMAALEAAVRHVCDDSKPTLGALISKYPDLLPKPLDEAVHRIWGYASEQARHGREGQRVTRSEAELVVHLSCTVVTYVLRKKTELEDF